MTGFLGVVMQQGWPPGVQRGDYVEIRAESLGDVIHHRAARVIDKATLRAVQQFFDNGGRVAHVFGICIESEQDLLKADPFSVVFHLLIDRLRASEDINILAMPVLAYLPVTYEKGEAVVGGQAIIDLLLDHCQEMSNRFLIIDPPRDLHEGALFAWVHRLRERNRSSAAFGALYYPWIMNGDAVFPPSGCVAGVYAQVESDEPSFGVRHPPANRVLKGVTHPAVEISWRDSDSYIDAHINPILTQPARGVVIWGARTLSLDERWMHVNSRRIMNLVTEQLRRDSEWVVFENQRPELWEIVKRTATNRLDTMWAAGLLTGGHAREEYLVECDGQLNPVEVRDAGQVNVRVTLRPISTAEFIVVDLRLGQ
ncbi:MAG: phage tail sheath family protein [Myxococcales bacterium]|nr:phage tail sheath family protein [Myxococcales bacterium]